jgi:colanic acid biosynthesis glycosyl transferase WcaI
VHIAFFNRSYYPDQTATGQLLTELCEHLVRDHGCRVTVVTGVPLQPLPGRDVPPRERHHGVDIVRARGTRWSKARLAGRASNYVTYFLSACDAGWRLDAPDVVVALTDPPIVGLAAWIAGVRHRAPLVMAFQDIFPEVAVLMEDFHSPVVNAALQAVNQFLVQRATRSVAIGETMRRRLIDGKGAPADRIAVIPNWADTSAIQPGPRENAFARAHDLVGRFVVMHSGNLGLSQSLETLVDAAALLRDHADVRLVLQGEGVKKAELEARVGALGLTNVIFLPFAPQAQLGESLAAADLCVVSLRRGLAGYIVPSKLYGILAAGRPFIAAVEPECEVASLATTNQCGLVTEPGNARALADAILTCRADRDRLATMGANARAIAASFDRAAQVARYFEVFSAATRRERPGTVAAAEEEAHVGRG